MGVEVLAWNLLSDQASFFALICCDSRSKCGVSIFEFFGVHRKKKRGGGKKAMPTQQKHMHSFGDPRVPSLCSARHSACPSGSMQRAGWVEVSTEDRAKEGQRVPPAPNTIYLLRVSCRPSSKKGYLPWKTRLSQEYHEKNGYFE